MLMVFESVRQFGASILASAGIAGIIIGFAAQRSIATLLAGFQIALTQPIRVDDVVIVENEWGRIEEITLTYVVVRIWDLRRLIVPITHFIEQPFQNWTRVSADILGTVFLYVDYTVPVDALRAELTRILRRRALWDGKVNVLQVTDAKEHTLEVRALASAADAPGTGRGICRGFAPRVKRSRREAPPRPRGLRSARHDNARLPGQPAAWRACRAVLRYLRTALTEGQAMVTALTVQHEGTCRTSSGSRRFVVTRRPGFVWDGRITMMPGLNVARRVRGRRRHFARRSSLVRSRGFVARGGRRRVDALPRRVLVPDGASARARRGVGSGR
jgi:hypothetical protein